MLRTIFFLQIFLFSTLSYSQASKLYQIDAIVFSHNNLNDFHDYEPSPLIKDSTHNAIKLLKTSEANAPYQLLAITSSQLLQAHQKLKKSQKYRILGHFSWLQPDNNKKSVSLPEMHLDDWTIGGLLRIEHHNYYNLNAELIFSIPHRSDDSFTFVQKQRLKENVVYYLDHPKAGLLIKIHKIT